MDTALVENAVVAAPKKKERKEFYFGRVSVLEVVLAIKHLSIMLKSSLAIEDTIKALADQATDKRLKKTWEDILHNVQSGMSLADSMDKHKKVFPHVVVSIIRAGEEGGTLEKNLVYLADYIKKDYELKKKVKGALFYPMFILSFTMIELMGFMFFVIPKLESFFLSLETVPAFTQFILNVSTFIREQKFFIFGGLVLTFILGKVFFGTKLGIRVKDKVSLNFPIIKKLIRQSILANFSRTLGILLDSGIPITKALEISSTTVSSYSYSVALHKVFEGVKAGNNLAESLAKHPKFFPGTYSKLIAVGEETGTLEDNLLYLHEFYAEEVNDMSNNLTTLLEPILLVFIGLMIGILAIALIVPIFQVTGSLGG